MRTNRSAGAQSQRRVPRCGRANLRTCTETPNPPPRASALLSRFCPSQPSTNQDLPFFPPYRAARTARQELPALTSVQQRTAPRSPLNALLASYATARCPTEAVQKPNPATITGQPPVYTPQTVGELAQMCPRRVDGDSAVWDPYKPPLAGMGPCIGGRCGSPAGLQSPSEDVCEGIFGSTLSAICWGQFRCGSTALLSCRINGSTNLVPRWSVSGGQP